MATIVYRCHCCQKEYDPNELPDLEEFNEEGDYFGRGKRRSFRTR